MMKAPKQERGCFKFEAPDSTSVCGTVIDRNRFAYDFKLTLQRSQEPRGLDII